MDPDGGGPLRAPLAPLGAALFGVVAPQNRLPVGDEVVFSSAALENFIRASLNAGKPAVTIVVGLLHDGKVPVTDWKNFNYLFNAKEQTTLNTDTSYDADTTDPNNPLGSPWSGASNAEDANGFSPFSPQLILTVPEPSASALSAITLGVLLARRRAIATGPMLQGARRLAQEGLA